MRSNKPRDPVFTHEGAKGQQVSPWLELRRTVLTCLLWEPTFYESGDSVALRIKELVEQVEPAKVAALAREAKDVMYLRHVPLYLAVLLAKKCSQEASKMHKEAAAMAIKEAKDVAVREKLHKDAEALGTIARTVVRDVIQRPDEMGEMLKLYWTLEDDAGKCSKPVPNAILRGVKEAFGKFDRYQFSKWDREARVDLKQVMFLSHPVAVGDERKALYEDIANGKLAPADTWEVALSASKTAADKKAAWERLLGEGKLPGMATLMNLRNMEEVGVDRSLVKPMLEKGIYRGLPFRYITAAKHAMGYEDALDKGMLASLKELEVLPGTTTIVVDVSGSMDVTLSNKSKTMRIDAAAGLAVIVREKCAGVNVATFSNKLAVVPSRRGMALVDAIHKSQPHGATHLAAALTALQKLPEGKCDRLIVITDEQAHGLGGYGGAGIVRPWVAKAYCINVAPYQHGVSYGNGWVHIDGWSDGVYKYIVEVEKEGG